MKKEKRRVNNFEGKLGLPGRSSSKKDMVCNRGAGGGGQ